MCIKYDSSASSCLEQRQKTDKKLLIIYIDIHVSCYERGKTKKVNELEGKRNWKKKKERTQC